MDAAMIAVIAALAICLGIAEIAGMLWDAIWRYM